MSNNPNEIKPDVVKTMIEMYTSGTSSEAIAEKFDCDGSTVCRILKRNNIAIRPATENKVVFKKDEDYFENIDTEDKAYFLGLLYANGNIHKLGNDIKISMPSADDDIIRKFAVKIYGHEKLNFYSSEDGKTSTSLNFYSKKLKDDLAKHGCMPNKSFLIRFPELEENLMRHFIRGHFDGDGCISIASNKSRICITSNKEFLEGLGKYIGSKLNVSYSLSPYKKSAAYDLWITNIHGCVTFLNYLYKDSNYYMNRKYNLYLDLLKLNSKYLDSNGNIDISKLKKAPVKLTDEAKALLVQDHKNGVSPKDLAEKYNINRNTVYELVSKKSNSDKKEQL